eukprot:362182-Chlamydomonas_euryale.AAC.1
MCACLHDSRSQYVSEVVAAIADAPLSAKDVPAAVQVRSAASAGARHAPCLHALPARLHNMPWPCLDASPPSWPFCRVVVCLASSGAPAALQAGPPNMPWSCLTTSPPSWPFCRVVVCLTSRRAPVDPPSRPSQHALVVPHH